MAFGRPGAGAPVRTKSGRLRSTVVGNPEIRWAFILPIKFVIILITIIAQSVEIQRFSSFICIERKLI